jgi:hypothetical protein
MLGEHCTPGIPRLAVTDGAVGVSGCTVEYQVESRLSFEAEGEAVEVTLLHEVDLLPAEWLEGLTAKAS